MLSKCSQGDDVAGTGSQAGNGKVVATVLYPDVTPAKDAEVFLRKSSYLRDISESGSKRIPDTYIDKDGLLSLDSVEAGNYFIEINDNTGNAQLYKFEKEPTDTALFELDTIILLPAASLSGIVDMTNVPDSVNVYVQTYGLEYLEKVDTTGHFLFKDIPSGNLTLKISGSDPDLGTIDTQRISIDSAEDHDAGTFHLPFNLWRDTLVVRRILDSNGLKDLPVSEVIKKIENGRIVKLDLSDLDLLKILPEIGDLKLTYLDLSENLIDTIPPQIGKLRSLIHLDISNNALRRITKAMHNCINLEYLDVSFNNIRHLIEIEKLHSLSILKIKNNSIKMLPKQIGQLSNLTVLDLSYNRFEILPPGITELQNLIFFLVDNNYLNLTMLPTGVEEWIDINSKNPYWRETQNSAQN